MAFHPIPIPVRLVPTHRRTAGRQNKIVVIAMASVAKLSGNIRRRWLCDRNCFPCVAGEAGSLKL
jgi:hypothetical protein